MVEIILDGKRCDVWEGEALPREIFTLDTQKRCPDVLCE